MKVLRVVLMMAMFGVASSLHAQVSTGAHPAAGDAHPAKADPHPAAPVVAHPANPNYSPETNSTKTLGGISAPQPFTTNSINPTTSAAVVVPSTNQNFTVPTFVDTQTNSATVPASSSTPSTTDQDATTAP